MTREEKIQFIKETKAGNFQKLKEIKEEERYEEIVQEYFYPCFFYLCEIKNENDCDWKYKFTIDRFAEIKQAMHDYSIDGNLDRATEFTWEAIFKVHDILEGIYKNNTLSKLDPYKEIYSKKLKLFQYGNNPPIRPGNFKEIYGWE